MQIYGLEPHFYLQERPVREIFSPAVRRSAPPTWAPGHKASVLTPVSFVLLRAVSEPAGDGSHPKEVSGKGHVHGRSPGGLQRVTQVSAPRGVTEHSPALEHGRGQAFQNQGMLAARTGRDILLTAISRSSVYLSNMKQSQHKRSPFHPRFSIKASKPLSTNHGSLWDNR